MIENKTIQTPKGMVEYLEGGTGPDLVFLHGAGGVTADSPFLKALATLLDVGAQGAGDADVGVFQLGQ